MREGFFNLSLSLSKICPEKFLSMSKIAERLSNITTEIQLQAKEWKSITPQVLAVSKKQDISLIREALKLGHKLFGENIIQEAQNKWPQLKTEYPDIKLHLIGHLQSNKVNDALDLFDVIETIDSEKLAKLIAKNYFAKKLKTEFLIQINIGAETQKYGIDVAEADDFINFFKYELKLPLKGIMCIPPQDENPSPYFAFMCKIAEKNQINYISQGMSSDYIQAVQIGTNEIRIGSALFGQRKY